ncbi:MAG: glycosyl hydrolase-related protein, partial [Terriglobia bacterium]
WGKWNTLSPFWWAGPDGSKVLMSYSRQYSQLAFLCQLPPQMAACAESLPVFLQSYESPSYKPDAALVYGSQVENTAIIPGTAAFVERWNAKYAYPRFILSTFPDYFKYIDSHFGADLPTVTGDGGPYWEDGVGTDARGVAIGRTAQQRALSAEKLSTLGSYVQKNVAGEQDLIRSMWQNLILFSEHTFTSWGGYDRPQSDETQRQQFTKNQFVVNARQEIGSIVDQSMSQLADQIHIPAPAIVVFNPLSWSRSGLVETDLDDGLVIKEYPSMEIVPYEVLRRGNGYKRIRFMALNVPAMGYQCYAMSPAPSKAPPADSDALPLSNTIENAYYRVRFDPASGALSSIYDKQLGKELVNTAAPYRMNQYLYVSGGEGTQIVYLDKTLPEAKLAVTPSGAGRVTSIRKTPYGIVMTYETQGVNAPRIAVNVMLFNNQKKIELVDHVQKQPVMHKEAVYFAFPFAIAHPDFDYEIQNGWVDPAQNILKGGSLDWFTVRHWVRVSGTAFSAAIVPVDAPLVTLGDINRGTWPKKFNPKSATVFSYVMNNYWHTNYFRVQSGKYTFRYVLTSGQSLSPVALARLGRASMTPMEVRQVISNDKNGNPARPLSPDPKSFLSVSAPNVVVEDWKMAEDGRGAILRLIEVGGQDATATLTFPLFRLEKAWRTNAVEENLSPLPVQGNSVQVPVKPHQIVTLRVVAAMM